MHPFAVTRDDFDRVTAERDAARARQEELYSQAADHAREAAQARAERDNARKQADNLAQALDAMVRSYDEMPGLAGQRALRDYERWKQSRGMV